MIAKITVGLVDVRTAESHIAIPTVSIKFVEVCLAAQWRIIALKSLWEQQKATVTAAQQKVNTVSV